MYRHDEREDGRELEIILYFHTDIPGPWETLVNWTATFIDSSNVML